MPLLRGEDGHLIWSVALVRPFDTGTGGSEGRERDHIVVAKNFHEAVEIASAHGTVIACYLLGYFKGAILNGMP
jgi:hypothetical protein